MPAFDISPKKTRVGWIGTGVIGSSMVGHLITAGYSTTLFTRSKHKASGLKHPNRWPSSRTLFFR